MKGVVRWENGKAVYFLDGKRVSEKKFRAAIQPAPSTGEVFVPRPGNWPLLSDSAGVNPKYAQQERDKARAHGVDIDFHPETGQAIFTSAAQRKAYCRLNGIRDNNGGYSDPIPD